MFPFRDAFQPSTSLVTQNRPTRESATLTPTRALIGSFGMSNVLSEEEKTTSLGIGEARMARTAHRASHGYASRNSSKQQILYLCRATVCVPSRCGCSSIGINKGVRSSTFGGIFPSRIEVIIESIQKLFARPRFQHAP